MPETIEFAAHEALKNCGYRCEGEEKTLGFRDNIRCDEEHGKPGKHYKGKVILQVFQISRKVVAMLCFKCLVKYTREKQRNTAPKPVATDKDQNDLFTTKQNKYSGPKHVPDTSVAAYNESSTRKKMYNGIEIARNLLRKFPGRTAYELLEKSQTFTSIYELRRYLSDLKAEKEAYNPSERKCSVVKRKTFTWSLV